MDAAGKPGMGFDMMAGVVVPTAEVVLVITSMAVTEISLVMLSQVYGEHL